MVPAPARKKITREIISLSAYTIRTTSVHRRKQNLLVNPDKWFLPVQTAHEKGGLNSALLQARKLTVILPASGSVPVILLYFS